MDTNLKGQTFTWKKSFWGNPKFIGKKLYHLKDGLWFWGDGINITIMKVQDSYMNEDSVPRPIVVLEWEIEITTYQFASVMAVLSKTGETLEKFECALKFLNE